MCAICAKRQADPLFLNFAAFHYRMLPMVLRAAAHHDQLTMLQHQFALFLRALVAQGEFARRAQTKRSNHGVVPLTCPPPAVPG